jgi:gentisate 1,2-dioxygenase
VPASRAAGGRLARNWPARAPLIHSVETGEKHVKTSRGIESKTGAERYSERATAAGLAPLWTFFKEWFSAEPRPSAVAHLWRFDELRPLIMTAADVVSTADAERRVLALENPGLPGAHLATDSLYAGIQLIMPGEFARAHRHSAAALRFIIEGSDTYTAVAGEKAYMEPGDFIVTPSWSWHEHRNESESPTIWLDVLDVPLVRFLGAGFSEHYAESEFPAKAPPAEIQQRGGRNNLLTVDARRAAYGSPHFSYPYARARDTLEHLKTTADWDPCHAIKTQYVDPATGGPAIPTISTFLQLVPKGFATEPYRATSSAIVSVVAGTGVAAIGSGTVTKELRYAPRDLFAVPSWHTLTLRAETESVLFSASDEAVQRKLGVWRERRGRAE